MTRYQFHDVVLLICNTDSVYYMLRYCYVFRPIFYFNTRTVHFYYLVKQPTKSQLQLIYKLIIFELLLVFAKKKSKK